jgi:hypothetical protein
MTETLADLDQGIRLWQRDLPCAVPLRDEVESKTWFRYTLWDTEGLGA